MKIIVLSGKNNTGKTATLKYVMKYLLSAQAVVVAEQSPGLQKRLSMKTWDAWAIFKYGNSYIAITTRGDQESFIHNDFAEMEQFAEHKSLEIDVYICAVHTTGKTVDYIKQRATALGAELHIYGKSTFECNDKSYEAIVSDQINRCHAELIFKNI